MKDSTIKALLWALIGALFIQMGVHCLRSVQVQNNDIVNERIRAAEKKEHVIVDGKEVPFREAGIYDPCNEEDMKKFREVGGGMVWDKKCHD